MTIIAEQATQLRSPAGLLRRLGALISDSLVVLGLLLLGSLLFVPLLQVLGAKALVLSEVGLMWTSIYWVWLLAIWIGFFGFFWTRTGQTIGMRAWRVRVEDERGALLKWSQAVKRLGYAVLPWLPCLIVLQFAERSQSVTLRYVGEGLSALGVLGLLWMYVDPLKRTWHDRCSQSRVIMLPKP